MKYIKNIKCEVEEYDEEGTQYFTDLSAPTIEMVIEKMGAYERSREDDKYKSQELVEDDLAKIEDESAFSFLSSIK